MVLFVNPQIEFRVLTGFKAKTETKTSKHPSIKGFIFYVSHFLPIWPKPKLNQSIPILPLDIGTWLHIYEDCAKLVVSLRCYKCRKFQKVPGKPYLSPWHEVSMDDIDTMDLEKIYDPWNLEFGQIKYARLCRDCSKQDNKANAADAKSRAAD